MTINGERARHDHLQPDEEREDNVVDESGNDQGDGKGVLFLKRAALWENIFDWRLHRDNETISNEEKDNDDNSSAELRCHSSSADYNPSW